MVFKKNVISVLLIFTLVLLLSIPGFPQIRFGGTFGLSKANLIFDIADSAFNSNPKTGFMVGALAQYSLSDAVNIRSGITYTQKGFKDSEDFFTGTREVKVNLSYYTLPLLAQYKFNRKINSAYAAGGMEIGILSTAESVEIISGLPLDIGFITNGTITKDIKDLLSDVDVTWNIGGGYGMEIGGRKVFAELQFTFGLNDIDDVDEESVVRSRGIVLGIGYLH